jgi:hypothetical protein
LTISERIFGLKTVSGLQSAGKKAVDCVSFSAHNMSMQGTERPEALAKTFLARLAPILQPLFGLLEAAAQQSYQHHDDRGAKSVDPWFFSHYVRWELWRGLDALRRAGEVDFFLARKPMSGIEVAYDGLRLKILRPGDDDDSLPDPKSDQQRLFYSNNIFTGGREDLFIIKNLVALWDYDHSFRSVSMSLVCPRDDGSMFFSIAVPHPATQLQSPTPAEPVEDLHFEAAEDESAEKVGGEGDGDDRRTP